jgi:multiple sugar transport system ATP-binding protein
VAEVRLRQLSKSFGSNEILREIDLQVEDGEFAVFVGPSGCGKSTTLRLIAGLETVGGGEIWIGGQRAERLPPAQRQVAMVFQNYALYPHMNVADNMGFSLRVAGVARAVISESVGRAAEVLRIAHLLDRMPRQLSGGERQRVAIGRAIVRQPKVFLFDEPLSNLDAALRVEMRLELRRLHETLGTTMIYVTHDQTEAMTLGDRVALFNRGAIVQVGAPLDLFDRPVDRFTARFLGSPPINLLPVQWLAEDRCWQVVGTRVSAESLGGSSACPDPERATSLGVRPESWQIGAADSPGLPVRVRRTEHLGDSVLAYGVMPGWDDLICVRLAADQPVPRSGDAFSLSVTAARTHWFDASERRL